MYKSVMDNTNVQQAWQLYVESNDDHNVFKKLNPV